MKEILVGAAVTLGAVSLIGLSLRAEARSHGTVAVRAAATWSGDEGTREQRRDARITTQVAWQEAWSAHGHGRAPTIDFDAFMVLAFEDGAETNCRGIGPESIEESADRITVRLRHFTFQSGRDGGMEVSPYGFFLVPRSSKMVVVEQDVRSLIQQAPVWQERIRFEREVRS